MKVFVKSALFYKGKIYKKGDRIEIETAAFKPWLMAEIAEAKVNKSSAETKPTTKKSKKKE